MLPPCKMSGKEHPKMWVGLSENLNPFLFLLKPYFNLNAHSQSIFHNTKATSPWGIQYSPIPIIFNMIIFNIATESFELIVALLR